MFVIIEISVADVVTWPSFFEVSELKSVVTLDFSGLDSKVDDIDGIITCPIYILAIFRRLLSCWPVSDSFVLDIKALRF